ncbi:MAG: flagellar hook-basal body complex protein FliE [Ignavibacteriae bacterium]|nr:flagellar hook-basal body complex protein FliE [Ignavibacteriota bacterium]MCB9258042.1 flagellar hook-basal body complex protein FliE [Ignavibacteriales bacterium]
MKAVGLNNLIKSLPGQQENQKQSLKHLKGSEFNNMLGDFIKGVNTDQLDSKQMVSDFVEGKDVELHEVMIAGQKAKTSLELLMQIRNKTVDMYKELTRM